MKIKYLPILTIPPLLATTSAAIAQSYRIPSFVMASGGSTCALDQYILSGTIGQPAVGGPLTAGNYSLVGGFWAEGAWPRSGHS